MDILFLHVGKMSPGDEAEALRLMAPRIASYLWDGKPGTESSGDDEDFGTIADPDSHVRSLKEGGRRHGHHRAATVSGRQVRRLSHFSTAWRLVDMS